MEGKRIAVYGLGRSGLAIARAAKELGGLPTIFDRARPEQMVKQDSLESARELGVPLSLGWNGSFDPAAIDLVVTNPAVDMRSAVLQDAAAAGIEILSEVEFAYRISKAPIVAITGTNGKSTTTVMTYLALRECGIDAVLCGNIFGTGLPEIPLTEAALNSTPDQVLVAEISSFQLEWVSQFRPAVAGITNIWPDHLDRYDSFQQYADTKHRIFAAQTAEDYAVVKAFDPHVNVPGQGAATPPYRGRGRHGLTPAVVTPSVEHPKVLTFGAQGEHAQVGEEEIRILDKVIRADTMQVIGSHNYGNAAMAGLLAWATLKWLAARDEEAARGPAARLLLRAAQDYLERKPPKRWEAAPDPATVDALPDPIVSALQSFRGIEHRMEFLGEKDGVKVINNSMCTNPDALVKSAQAVKGPNHLIIGGRDKNLMGAWSPVKNYLASGMHRAYLFGEAKDALNTQLGGGFGTYNTLQDAFRAATEKARGGEVIMLAPGCASTDQFNDFRDRGNVFKSIAKEWLQS